MTKDELRAYNAAYHAKHRAARLEAFREWKAKNRDAHRGLSAEWQKNNPERSAALKAAYKKRHPEKASESNKRKTPAALAAHAARQSARNRALAKPDEAVTAVYAACAADGCIPCHWCEASTEVGDRHVDHLVPLSKGGEHVASNLVISCIKCNLQKGALLPDEFRARRTT